MNIGLIGFSCSGKSSLLSFAKGYFQFVVDSDLELEKSIGNDFLQFIKEKGESQFRDKESVVIKEIAELTNSFVAFGGGVNYLHSSYGYIRDSFKLIYVYEDFEALIDRALREKKPLLEINGIEKYRELYDSRLTQYYKAADFVVVSEKRSLDLIWEEIKWIINSLQN